MKDLQFKTDEELEEILGQLNPLFAKPKVKPPKRRLDHSV